MQISTMPRLVITLSLVSVFLITKADFCSHGPNDTTKPLSGQFELNSDSSWTTDNDLIITDSSIESDCQNNHKIFVFHNKNLPLTNGTVTVVNYFKPVLAQNEVTIDVTDGNYDFLSTGDTTPISSTQKVSAYFTLTGNTFELQYYHIPVQLNTGNGPQADTARLDGFLAKNQ